MDGLIHELVVTMAADLENERVGFGGDGAMAKRVFDWITNRLMNDGLIMMLNFNNPNLVEVIQRGGPTLCWIELTSGPESEAFRPDSLFRGMAAPTLKSRNGTTLDWLVQMTNAATKAKDSAK